MSLGKSQFFSPPFTPAIGRYGLASVELLLSIAIPTRACGGLTRKIDEFPEIRVILKTGLDQILRSEGIHLKVDFFLHRLGDARQMKYLIDILDRPPQRGGVTAIPGRDLDGKAFKPLQIAPFPHEAADLDASLKKAFGEMASNKPCSSCHQRFQIAFPLFES
jgi:hypothetical protein